MPSSTFDSNTFLETTIDTTKAPMEYILPPPGDYLAQITDKITAMTGLIGPGKERAGETWCSIQFQWELMDDGVRQALNMDHVFVRQGIMVDLQPGSTPDRPLLDLSQNKSQRLKDLYKALGLVGGKGGKGMVSPNHCKFQTATVKVEHRRPTDANGVAFDNDVAEVVRVISRDRAPNGRK